MGRRPVPQQHPKLTSHVVDFAHPGELPRADETYIALGTTIKVAGSQQAFYAVDHDAVLAVARAAREAGCTRLGVVTAMGASKTSSIFYNRVKGETEDDLSALGYDSLVIARPSFLVGDRAALGQPLRSGERVAMRVSEWFRPLIPANLRAIQARKVAAALLSTVPAARPGQRVMLSGELQQF